MAEESQVPDFLHKADGTPMEFGSHVFEDAAVNATLEKGGGQAAVDSWIAEVNQRKQKAETGSVATPASEAVATAQNWEAGKKAASNVAKVLEKGAAQEAKLQIQTKKRI